MNPLTKIAQYTEQTSKKMDKVIELLSKPTSSASVSDSGGASKIDVTNLNALGESLSTISESSEGLEKASSSIGTLSKSISTLMKVISEVDPKSIETFDTLAKAINVFAVGIAKSSILLLTVIIAVPLLYLSMITLIPLFMLLGKVEEQIYMGAEALDRIGTAMVSFGIGLATFALVSAVILMEPMLLMSMVASITVISAAFALIGGKQFSKRMRNGAAGLTLVGLSLIPFAIGYALFAAMFPSDIGIGTILLQAAVIGGIGLAVGLIGKLPVVRGALGLAAIGLSLLVFSLGYKPFTEATSDLEFGDILIQGGILLAVGTAFAIAGFAAPLIILGSIAFGAAGLALMALAPGLQAMKDLQYTEEDGKILATTLASVAMAFSGTDSESGFFANVGKAFARVGESGVMLAAAASYTAAGLALITLSKGLGDFQKIEFTEEDAKTLALTLSSVSAGFAQAGGEPSNPGGLFGAVFGNMFSPNAVERGIDSVMDAGEALTSIAQGIIEFQKLVDSKIDFDVVGESIKKTVGFVQQAFAAVGGEGTVEAGGFFGSLFGIKKNKVAEGISSVQGAGNALTDIAKGITEFDKLVKSEIDWDSVGSAITKTVGFVQQAFAAIGGEGNVEGGGFFNSLFGIKQNKVQEGINSVQGAGDALIGIAKGITEFDKLVKSEIDWDGVGTAIEKTLGFVGTAFARIGGMEEEDGWFVFSWDENLVQKGIEAVKGAGEELKNIATGLKTISEISDPQKVADNLGLLLTSIGDNFKMLYETNPEINDRMSKVGTFITDISEQAKAGNLTKAAEEFKNMADAINSIELEKSDSLGNIFKYASELTKDETAIVRLSMAVEEIRNIMVAKETGPATDLGAAPAAPITQPGEQPTGETATDNMGDLKNTLTQINTTLSNLPSAIASIEIRIPED